MIRWRAGWAFLGCGVLWLVLCLIFELSTGLLGATNLPGTATPSATASGAQLQASPDELWRMYNAIEKDEGYLQIIFVAFPALITLAVFITPFMLGAFVNTRVNAAIDERITAAHDAMQRAQNDYLAKSKELDLKLDEVQALTFLRLAYLHWRFDDRHRAVNYAKRAAETAQAIIDQGAASQKLRDFQSDANDSLAYYLGELNQFEPIAPNDVNLGIERGVAMLNRLGAASGTSNPDIETVDSCLFVLWAFRTALDQAILRRAKKLFDDTAGALGSNRWQSRQSHNYELYRNYFQALQP